MKFRPQVESLSERIVPSATPITSVPPPTTADGGGNAGQVTPQPIRSTLQMLMAKLDEAESALHRAAAKLDDMYEQMDHWEAVMTAVSLDVGRVYFGLIAAGLTDAQAKADPSYLAVVASRENAILKYKQAGKDVDAAEKAYEAAKAEVERIQAEIESHQLVIRGIM